MKKYIKPFIALVLTAVGLNSCDFKDINVNPNSPTDAPMNVLLPAAQANLAYGIHGDIAQFTSIFTQQLGGVENIYLSVGQYDLNGNLAARVWDGNLYPGAMKDLDVVIRKANETRSPHYRGVARILMAAALGQAVDLWNNVPYSEAFRGADGTAVTQPRYDRGEVLYDTIQNMLSQAIVDLQATTSTFSPSRDDLVYGGNRTRWQQAARALKARYFNHLSKVAPEQSAQNALAALQGGGLTSNAEDARIVFGNSQDAAGPWFRFLVGSFGNGVRMGESFVNLLIQRNDPRLPFYVRANTGATPFVGSPAGVSRPTASQVGGYFNRPESPVNFISFVEQKFIEAEALLRLNRRAEAATAFNAAVAASLTKVTAPIASFNLTTNATANQDYIRRFGSETQETISLDKIFTEKYIALALEPETWNDWRRSITPATPNGVPALSLAASSQQFTAGRFPRRWPYPLSEVQLNRANVEAQGPATITDRVFWDR
ncbi:SusD/RagB family nutrient-binding outer membrane lipoprotein [Tellurirhabdus rosea]|uniref:SusD/RagB family nutrient-binding outer membrane lipoprotein n=1 Tax=Tellurirhabdus rosea TaxID=2674997 RepID=UPI0022577C8B|nr:SusD/RagB family nutrient-binding outer membrane lipoprotein [Tellurirhabdus rosea]